MDNTIIALALIVGVGIGILMLARGRFSVPKPGLSALKTPAPPEAELPAGLELVSMVDPPKGYNRFCTKCGKEMRLIEGGYSGNAPRRYFDGATGRAAIAYYEIWTCPSYSSGDYSSHDRSRLSDEKTRFA